MGMSLKIDDGLSHQLSPALDEPITLHYLSSWREDISMEVTKEDIGIGLGWSGR